MDSSPLTVPVVIDTDCEHEGVCEFTSDYYGRQWPTRIVLRAPEPRVLLHETLHALVATLDRDTLPVSHPRHEAMVRHITRGLWDAGWRPTRQEEAMSEVPEAAVRAAVDAVQEEFDERGLGPADLLVRVILDAALPHIHASDGERTVRRRMTAAFALALAAMTVYFVGALHDWRWYALAAPYIVIVTCAAYLVRPWPLWLREIGRASGA